MIRGSNLNVCQMDVFYGKSLIINFRNDLSKERTAIMDILFIFIFLWIWHEKIHKSADRIAIMTNIVGTNYAAYAAVCTFLYTLKRIVPVNSNYNYMSFHLLKCKFAIFIMWIILVALIYHYV